MNGISVKKAFKKVFSGGIISTASLLVCGVGLYIWTRRCEQEAHRPPAAERVDIEELVAIEAPVANTECVSIEKLVEIEEPMERPEWTEEELQVLESQTGLSREALEYLREQGRRQELLALQEAYYRPVSIDCQPNSIISREEHVTDGMGKRMVGMPIPYIEEGDILITHCSHVLGWRNGHAALVVDADRRLVLEAQVLGSPSIVAGLEYWETYPSFVVLRLEGADREERAAIAAYAEATLEGVPYVITAGIFDRLMEKRAGKEGPDGTHCSHLIWYAFQAFGYDLDSDGGLIVTPRDIAESDQLKVIQSYGIDAVGKIEIYERSAK